MTLRGPDARSPPDLVTLDLNEDGLQDVVTANASTKNISVLINNTLLAAP